MQPQGHVQVLLNMLVFGMNPQEALDAPRICYESPAVGEVKASEEVVHLEQGIPDDVVKGLGRLGHSVELVDGFDRAKFGRGQVIRRSVEDGHTLSSAGSDLRGVGPASPL